MKRLQWVIAGCLLAIVVAGGTFVWFRWFRQPELHGFLIQDDLPVADFTLAAKDNQQVNLHDYRGKVVLLYFGYTHCPDMCPTTLAEVKYALEKLGAQANDVQMIMISVDPERDTPASLADYVQRFDKRFIGVTGTSDEIQATASAFGIAYYKEEGSAATGYLVAHSAQLLVVDRSGHVRLIFKFGTPGDQMASDLKYLLSL
ncbi:MAG: SCO family protein [Caldilineaceae bacterium]